LSARPSPNASLHATGSRVRSLPITVDKIILKYRSG
jgi:CO/xanthine dehydrogenase Mo-binding subunit